MSARFAQTTIDAEVIRTTDSAVLIDINGREKWVPRRVCLDGNAIEEGDSDLIIADWWLKQEGLL